MLGSMQHDIIWNFEHYPTTQNMRNWLNAYGDISETRLPAMMPKFENYMMDSKHTMAEHLKVIKP